MEVIKTLTILLLAFISIAMADSEMMMNEEKRQSYGEGSVRSYQCPSLCDSRCSGTQYRKPCLFFCNKCCAKCLCVPPGFYGNKAVCPCYNNWKTKRGGPKCP